MATDVAVAAPVPAQRGFHLPIAIKFFLGSAFLIALAVGAAVVVTYLKGDQIAKRAVEDSLTTSSAVQKEFEQNRLDQLQLKIQLIAADPATSKYVAQAGGPSSALPGLSESGERDTQSITDLLKERQSQYAFDLGIVLDARGNVLGRTDQTEAFRESLADDPLVKPAVANASPFSGYWRLGNKLYQAAITPLQQDQALVGFLLLAQNVDNELCQHFAKLSGAQIAFWLPTDNRLQLAAGSFDDATTKSLQDALVTQSKDKLPSIMAGKTVERLPLTFAGQNWVAKVTPTAAEGEGSLGAVLTLTSTDRIVSSYRDILDWVLIGAVVSMIVALLLSYLLAKGILRPVRAMAQAAEQAAAGNYRTQIGLRGNDELARLSRAFDSLLSDLREKSDIEGYVGNLSRFLPEPASEGVRSPTPKALPIVQIDKPRRESLVLLGLEFRQLARLDAGESADAAQARFTEILSAIGSAAGSVNGILRGLSGPRFVVAFSGTQGMSAALRTLSEVHAWARTRSAQLPAAAIASGEIAAVAGERNHHVFEAWLGAQMIQIDRLLGESAPGQTLLARQSGDDLKSLLGDSRIAAAVGAVSTKRFYALSDTALKDLPAMTLAPESGPSGEHDTVVPVRVSTENRVSAPRTITRPMALDKGAVFGGRYQILSELGSGGMGVVYKAHDLELDDVVALKMLKPSVMVDEEQLDRLKSEIKLARRITHPNVLRTFDFGEVDGYPYISMEYVRGLTLRYLLNETKRIPFSAGLRIARQLCAGLAAAHEVGVLHRDIKPENLILEQNGNAKLMDFGIARPVRRTAPGHTQQGMFLGTPNYSAPEQLSGEPVDERADIYSSGVLMCEMFCGKLPYSGSNTMEIYMAQMQQAPIKPSEHWPEIPPALETLILKCVTRSPAERFQSAAELSQALSQLRA